MEVFEYCDYRALLRDCYRDRRKARSGWSYGVWARQLGLKSPSTLVMILKGRRNPSLRLTGALAKWMDLDPERASYFQDLVQLERSRKDIRLTALLMERLRKHNAAGDFRFVDPDAFAAISQWYCYAIREMVQLESFQEDPHWIRSHSRVPLGTKEIRDALKALLKMDLLRRREDGRLELGPGNIEVASEVANEAIQQFHEQAFANAARSLKATPPTRREVRGTVFPMSRSKLPQARELIRKFQNDLCDLLEGTGTDAVYQLEIALFPLAETRGGKNA